MADVPQDGPEQQRQHDREDEARAVVGHVPQVRLPESACRTGPVSTCTTAFSEG